MAPFYTVQDATGQIPDEHYCWRHLIGEAEYLSKHGLDGSGDIWLSGDHAGHCDWPGCRAHSRNTRNRMWEE